MRTFTTILTVTLAAVGIASLGGTAEAGCGRGRSYHHNYPVYHHAPRKVIVHRPIVKEVIVEKPVYIPTPVAAPPAPCFRPFQPICTVIPGDTWYTIAQRMYGNPAVWPMLAQHNRMAPGLQLQVGQQLQLPMINQNGTIAPQSAPATAPMGLQNQFGGLQGGMPAQFNQSPNANFGQFNPLQQGQPAQSPGIQSGQFNQIPAGQPTQVPASASQLPAAGASAGMNGQPTGMNLASLAQMAANLFPAGQAAAAPQAATNPQQ